MAMSKFVRCCSFVRDDLLSSESNNPLFKTNFTTWCVENARFDGWKSLAFLKRGQIELSYARDVLQPGRKCGLEKMRKPCPMPKEQTNKREARNILQRMLIAPPHTNACLIEKVVTIWPFHQFPPFNATWFPALCLTLLMAAALTNPLVNKSQQSNSLMKDDV